MKIVIIGANGQVAAEVCDRLYGQGDIDLVPVCRTRNGSAYLRSRGVAVLHNDLSDADEARRILSGADVVANFALAGGIGKARIRNNEAIIESLIAASPQTSKHIFFSTLAVNGTMEDGRWRKKTTYGDLKLKNEAFFKRLIKLHNQQGWILRLGHVCGEQQGITQAIRAEIQKGPVVIPEPDRASNAVYIETICEAIWAIATGQSQQNGTYDLVNSPQWTWNDVYAFEAGRIGQTATIKPVVVPPPHRVSLKSRLLSVAAAAGLRQRLELLLPYLSPATADKIRANFMTNRAAGEIAALLSENEDNKVVNSAALWPPIETNNFLLQANTLKLIEMKRYSPGIERTAWPKDIDLVS